MPSTETAIFSNVDFKSLGQAQAEERVVESTLEVISAQTGERRDRLSCASSISRRRTGRRTADIFSSTATAGSTRFPLAGGEPKLLDTGVAIRCNNDHGLSPDGKWLAISDQHDGPTRASTCFRAPAGRRAWSRPWRPPTGTAGPPTGSTLAYCAERTRQLRRLHDPRRGGPETRLTTAAGLDDGPEYSPGRRVHLLQLRADRPDEDLADEGRRLRPGAGDLRSGLRRLVRASFARRQSLLVFFPTTRTSRAIRPTRTLSLRIMPLPGGKPKMLAQLVRRTGHDQRSLLVAATAAPRRSSAIGSWRRKQFRISDCGFEVMPQPIRNPKRIPGPVFADGRMGILLIPLPPDLAITMCPEVVGVDLTISKREVTCHGDTDSQSSHPARGFRGPLLTISIGR